MKVMHNGALYTLYGLEKITGIKRKTLYHRLFVYKWNIEKAITQPVKKSKVKECI